MNAQNGGERANEYYVDTAATVWPGPLLLSWELVLSLLHIL